MTGPGPDLVRQQEDAINRSDAEAFAATCHPDVAWEDRPFWSQAPRIWRGRAEVRQWFTKLVIEPWESMHAELGEIIDESDERVIFGAELTASGRDSGAEIHQVFWSVYWLADGLIARREIFLEKDEAVEAATSSPDARAAAEDSQAD